MSDLDNKDLFSKRSSERVNNAAPGQSTDEVIGACQTPEVARALTTHFLGGYYAAIVPTVLRKREGWEQMIAGAIEDIVGKLFKLAVQMNTHGHPDIGLRIQVISDLVGQPINREVADTVRAKDDELSEYIRSKDSIR